MFIYQCADCKIQIELTRAVMKVVDGSVITKGSECPECGQYTREVEKNFTGFPSLIRREPTLRKK